MYVITRTTGSETEFVYGNQTWTSSPFFARQFETEAAAQTHLTEWRLQGKVQPKSAIVFVCLCEDPQEILHGGVPGVLRAASGVIERCDACARFESDEDAEQAWNDDKRTNLMIGLPR